jgi:chemotaxis protein histidine kinase CheA
MAESDNFVKQFLAESYESLDQLDRTLVELERNPTAADKLASIFRTVHSIKGTSSFFGHRKWPPLMQVATIRGMLLSNNEALCVRL